MRSWFKRSGTSERETFRSVPQCLRSERIRPLLWGASSLTEVVFEYEDLPSIFTREQEERVRGRWDEVVASGRRYRCRPVYRLLGWQPGRVLRLYCGPLDFRQHLGVSQFFPEWGLKSGVLTFICVAWCPEGVVLERRSPEVAECPAHLHCAPAGHIHPPHHLFEALLEEASEELGLESGEVVSSECLGLIEICNTGGYGLMCHLLTTVPFPQLLSRERSGSWEQSELICHDLSRGQALEGTTDGARWALALAGRRRWGKNWFASQRLWPA